MEKVSHFPAANTYEYNLSLLSLHFQRSLLNNAISDLEAAHATLREHYNDIHPKIRGNHMITFRYRMACQSAFENEEDRHFKRLIGMLRDNSALVANALALNVPDVAKFGLGLADANMDEVEKYIWALDECVQAHVETEGWMIWKGLLDLDESSETASVEASA